MSYIRMSAGLAFVIMGLVIGAISLWSKQNNIVPNNAGFTGAKIITNHKLDILYPSESLAIGETEMGKNSNINIGVENFEMTTINANSNGKTITDSGSSNFKRDEDDESKIADRLDQMSKRRHGKLFNKKDVKQALLQNEAWKLSRTPHAELRLNEYEKSDGRYFIETNPLRIESLIVNDHLTISIPHLSSSHELVVETIQYSDTVVTWKGRLVKSKNKKFTISRGRSLISGNVSTSEGSFEFRFVENLGWIHSSDKLFEVFEDNKDYLLPEEYEMMVK